MEARKRLDSFDLDNDRALDDEVEPIANIECDTLVENREPDLSPHYQSPALQLMHQAMMIGRFKQTGPKGTVNTQS